GQACEQRVDRVVLEPIEVHGREVRKAHAPGRAGVEQLRPAERHDEDRMPTRPMPEVLDEVEQARVSPLQILEQEDDRSRLCIGLEEPPPGGKQLLALTLEVPSRFEQRKQSRLD